MTVIDIDGFDSLKWQRDPSVGSLSDWQTDYGMPTPSIATSTVVPEPGALMLALAAVLLQVKRRQTGS